MVPERIASLSLLATAPKIFNTMVSISCIMRLVPHDDNLIRVGLRTSRIEQICCELRFYERLLDVPTDNHD